MRITELSIDSINPYAKNARIHSDKQIDQVAKSIKTYGFNNPILIDKENTIIAGHCRWHAAKSIGLEKVPTIQLDHLSKKQVKAYIIADNQLALNADWDRSLLESEIQDIFNDDMAMVDTLGFDQDYLKSFLDIEVDSKDNEQDKDVDDVPEIEKNKFDVKLGDVWQLGRHRIMCGDSTIKENIDNLLDGQNIDVVYTDPPYGMNLDVDFSKMKDYYIKKNNGKTKDGTKCLKRNQNSYNRVIGDDKPFDANFLLGMAKEVFLWGADYYKDTIPNGGSWIVWDKKTTDGLQKLFGSDFELCWSKKSKSRDILRVTWAGCFGFDKANDGNKRVHPTQKPIKLHELFFEKYCTDKNVVFDAFLGSGSTLIACEKTDRTCYGLELDPHYCSVIIQRYIDFVGSDKDVKRIIEGDDEQ